MTTKLAGIEFDDQTAELFNGFANPDREVQADLDGLRSGSLTPETLLEHCLDGAGDNDGPFWQDYVSTLAAAAERRSAAELRKYRDELAQARGSESTTVLIDRLLDGEESVRERVESMLNDIDRDLARNDE